MRINVYAEELTSEVQVIEKTAEDTGVTFYGIRVFLESPDKLHHTAEDDDRSAITFFVPWTRAHGHDFRSVEDVLRRMITQLQVAVEAESFRRQAAQ